jgi:predicted Zn-dependent peptidase
MVKIQNLQNGICLVGEEVDFVRSVSIGIWIKNGSVDEEICNNGISHFIEHMLFKGTSNRTAKDIADQMAHIGGRVNAFTSKEYMCYYAHVLDEHFDISLDILSDMIFNSIFNVEEMEKEKGVILEEISMSEDSPEDIVHDILQDKMWVNSPMAYSILGSKENVNSFTRNDLTEYLSKHYVADNIVISVVGKIDFDETVKKLNEKFSKISTSKPLTRKNNSDYKKVFVTRDKDIEQVHLCMAFPSISYDSDKIFDASVLNTILGGGLNSRLFQSIREEKGLAYSIYSFAESYKHIGMFNIYAATNPSQVEAVTLGIVDELDKLISEKFNEDELEQTKVQIKSNLIIGMESMNSRMSNYGKSQLILNRIKSQDEIINGINNVTIDSLKNLSEELFDYNKLSVSLVGKVNQLNLERIEGICKR